MSYIPAWLILLLLCLCFTGFVVAVIGGIFFFINRSVQGVNLAWGDVGMRTGLTFKPAAMFSQPELKGEFRQRPIRLYIERSTGVQGSSSTFTVIDLKVSNPTNSALEISSLANPWTFVGKMLHAQDVKIGDPAFDKRFVIKSNPPDFAVKLLAEARLQTAILEIPHEFRIHLTGPSLVYAREAVEDNAEFLTKLFNTLSDLADRLEGN